MFWRAFRVLFVLLFITGLSFEVFAQDSYTLKMLIDEALLQNYQIKLSGIREQQLSNNNTYGNSGFLPTLDVVASNSNAYNSTDQKFFTGESRTADGAKNTSLDAMVEANWVVFNGFRMFAQKRQLAKIEKAGMVTTRFFIEQTISDLAKFYFQLKQEQKLLEAFEASFQISNERLKLETQKFNIGVSSGLDVQKALVDRNRDSSNFVNQHAQVGSLYLDINTLINRNLTSKIHVEDTLLINYDINLDVLISNAMVHNSNLELANMQALIFQEDIAINKSYFYPQVNVFGNYTYRKAINQVGVLESNKSFGPSFGIQVRFNLFNGGRDQIFLENSRLDLEYSRIEKEQISNKVETAIQKAYLNYTTGIKGLKLEESNMKVAKETLMIAQKQYELRVISDIEFRLIQLSSLEAETNYLRQQLLIKNMEIDLYRLSGQLLNNI